MKLLSTLLLIFFSSILIAGVGYSGPESVAYDASTNTYFVANTNGYITQQTNGGALTMFTSIPTAPYGMVVLDGVLYVCDDGKVKGYDIATAAEVFNLDVGGSFLNGITSNGTNLLYVTDFNAKRIYKVNVTANSYTTFVNNTVTTPNGIAYDGENNRLVFVNWGMNAAIKQVSLSDSSVTTIKPTTLGNMDGIDRDCMGNWYVSSWSPTRITRFTPDFGIEQTVSITPPLGSPADIHFNPNTDVLAIPNSSLNTVLYETVSIEKAVIMQPNSPVIEVSLDAGATDQQILAFNLKYACGFNDFNELTVEVTDDYGNNLSNFRLIRSNDNSLNSTADNVVLGTVAISGNELFFSGFSESLSSTRKFFFVVADVATTVDETDYATFEVDYVSVSLGIVIGDNANSNVVNFNQGPTSIKNPQALVVLDAFPNPFEESFKINLPSGIDQSRIVVTNILGKVIHTQEASNDSVIPTKAWPKGVYFVQAPEHSEIHTLRIIKR